MGRIRSALAGKRAIAEASAAAVDAAVAALREAGLLVDADEALYRPAGGTGPRDLASFTQREAQEIAFECYLTNPLGHRITELNRDFIVGDGLSFTARNPDVEEVIRDFWTDPTNDFDRRLHDFALELGLYGEQVYEAFVGETSGVVQLGYIDPSQIIRVEPVPGNPLVVDNVRIRTKSAAILGQKRRVIRPRPGGEGGRLIRSGDVFYFRVNGVSNSQRGWPDLLHLVDWLDAYNEMLWEGLDRARVLRDFIWDVTVKGLSQADLESWTRKYATPPRPGSVRVHSDSVVWQAVSPTLGSAETGAEAETLLEHIAGGAGFPKHWLSSAEDVNRATAQEMGAPTIRRLSTRQNYFTACVHTMLAFVLDRAAETGRLRAADGRVPVYDDQGEQTKDTAPPADLVTVQAPEISPKDMGSAGTLLDLVTKSLAVAETNNWVSPEVAREVLVGIFAQLGYDFDPTQEPEEANPEAETQPSSFGAVAAAAEALRRVG